MRVLLVEKLTNQAKNLNGFFRSEGIVVECVETGAEALSLLRHYSFDIVVSNLVLPDMEGILLIARARAAGHQTPVLALSSLPNKTRLLAALGAGADDVVENDTDRAELLARMRAIIRRSRGFSQSILHCGKLALDLHRQDVTVNGVHIHLTHKELALLQLLMMRKNTVMTKEGILSNLYGGIDEPEIKIVDVFICKLRRKLAQAGAHNVIETVWGRGYVVRDVGRDNGAAPEPRVLRPIEANQPELAMA